MALNFFEGKKKLIFCISLILVMFFQYEFIIPDAQGRKETVSGYQHHDFINPNETVSYNFNSSNVNFEIFSNDLIELNIEYEPDIRNRQAFFILNTNDSLTLNISSKASMNRYNLPDLPREPSRGNNRYQYRYNCIYKIRSNQTIENLTLRYMKNAQFELDSDKTYSITLFESSLESWEIIDTIEIENGTTLDVYIESSFFNLSSNTDYYITIYEINNMPYDWTWLFVLISIGVIFGALSLAILISKKDYFQYLRTRTIPVEKGAHRLSLEQVLENENRGKIIDLILKKPGIHFNELLREMDIAAGNLVWHLDILETYKVVGKKRIGNFVAYFPYYEKNPLSNIDLKLQKSKLTLEILEMIEREPGIWNNFITKKMKVDHKTIQYHIDKLIELDLINFKKEGRKKKIYPNFDSEYYKKKNKDNL
jgi:DNA-binding transcriptional ArsR family regulator